MAGRGLVGVRRAGGGAEDAGGRVELDARLLLALPLAMVAVQVVSGGVDLLLAALLDTLQPGAAVTTYGWITGGASFCALVAYPLSGAASDRTPRRYGRRTLWVAVGALASAIGLLGLAAARTIAAVGATYIVAFASLPLIVVALYASIPDRVPQRHRGLIGSVVGAATIVGGVGGNLLAARFAHEPRVAAWAFAAVVVSGAAAFIVLGREAREPLDPLPAANRGPVTRRRGGMADLAWFSIGRFGIFLAYAAVAGLAYYILRDYVREPNPAAGVAAFAVVSGIATLVGSLVAGPWSDRVGRRKPFAVAACVLIGLGSLVPTMSASVPAFLVGGALIGLGFGAYLAAGTALATLILPDAASTGRDIGFIGLSNASAQVIAPLVGSYVAASTGYPALFVAATGACLVAALAIAPIRSAA